MLEDCSSLSVITIAGVQKFLQLEPDWKAIVAALRTENPFLHWEWVSAWVKHYCGDQLATVVVSDGEQVMAIAPFYCRHYQLFPGVQATCLQLYAPREIQELFELRELLAWPGREVALLQAVVTHLAASDQWDWVEFAAYEPALGAWDTVLGTLPDTFLTVHKGEELVPILPLEESWEVQRRGLKRNIKESIRHCYNSLKRHGHSYEFTIHEDRDAAQECLTDFLTLHRQRSQVVGAVHHFDQFAGVKERAFLAEVVPSMMEAGHLKFYAVKVGGEVVASRMVMTMQASCYLAFSGFDPRWWKYSVMTLLVTECIKDAIRRGQRSVNFSPGVDQSKIRWGGTTCRQRQFILVRRTAWCRTKLHFVEQRKYLNRLVRTTLYRLTRPKPKPR